MKAKALLVHAYEGMPPHPETLPPDDQELYEVMVEKHFRQVEPALEGRAEELTGALGVGPQLQLVAGSPAQALLEVAGEDGEPSVVVVGSRGLGATERVVLGSVSTKVVRAARVPVLVCSRGKWNEI